ncbi:ATP-binding protein [Haloarchaeobius iranensis]|uniref:Protoporphyrin IX magnesium-chelatase n=1 Tax=Haloarchaeobius iranensis TaxID=996166 RepID=A0A1G9ZNJ5_9EURY|nr:ATP-binding protein [Haloarchaeobius iranensis]SDN22814.1 protoporphyrin IX magnesium-chelatase [Haloarchaeobius iranensis]
MVDYGGGKKASHGRGASLSFSEIVGQAELKSALLAIAANDDLDGLLVQGEKGTAKSTAVRALTDLLPTQDVIEDCPYGCPPSAPAYQCEDCRGRTDPPTTERSVPLVTLPLGATRERVVGTLSVADALGGEYEFDPGLLARANRGILYVDEVNLLDDHLVDVLLDAAANGVNRIERDGMSVTHPARFTLVGTMNPEEGDLRPQLRDRFALQATVTACEDVDKRVGIIDRALGRGDGDAASRSTNERVENGEYRDQLLQARGRLSDVELSTQFARDIAELCRDSGVDGHRGDIATARAARTFAALDGRTKVIEADVQRAAALALPHRLRSRPFEETPDPGELIEDHFDGEDTDSEEEDRTDHHDEEPSDADEERSEGADDTGDAEGTDAPDSPDPGAPEENGNRDGTESGTSFPERSDEGGAGDVEPTATDERRADETGDTTEGTPIVPGESCADIGAGRAPELTAPEAVENGRAGSGSRSRTQPHVDTEGARVRSQQADSTRRIDVAASVRAASARGASSVESRDLRQSVRQSESAALVVFVVDASASMSPAMRAAKGTVLELLKDAYQKRDEVAFVAFAGEEADVLLPPTDSVTLAARHLKDLPTGDRTPLPSGLRTAGDVLDRADPSASVVVLVTDGRANVAVESPVRETREAARRLSELDPHVVVVDASDGDRSGVTGLVVDETDGESVPLSALSAERIEAAVAAAQER